MALPNTPVGYDSWNSYIEINAPALAASQGITLQQAKASLKLLNVSEPIRGAVGEPYYREYNVFTTWADRALLPEPGRPWKLAPSFTVLSLFAQGEQGAWYDPSDLTTMYQTSTGTTPVTAAGQQVGLLLDKSQGLVLGSERVSNGDFTSGADWSLDAGASIGSGQLTFASVSSTFGASQNLASSFSAGQFAQVTVKVDSITAGQFRVRLNGGTYFFVPTSPGTYTFYVQAGGSGSAIQIHAAGTTSGTIDNISVKLLPGNHATQATSAQRPTLGRNPVTGTRNLLTFTEQFDNAVWVKLNATITANTSGTTDPLGGNTADAMLETTTNGSHRATYSQAYAAGTYTFSCYAKTIGGRNINVEISASGGAYVLFDAATGGILLSGTYGTGFTLVGTPTATNVGNGWWRCVITASVPAATILTWVGACNGTSGSYVGDITKGLYVWGAQFETGSTATAYQRVVSAFDVTEAGVADAWYLSCDGTDDGMVTNTITPGIDKAQVFAGVRKLSDSGVGVFVEFSSIVTNAGSFAVYAPNSAGTYASLLSGSALGGITYATFAAPITNVLSNLYDIARSTIAEEITFRANGAVIGGSSFGAANAGTGNFLAYPLYIGRRGGTTLPFNGRIYSLIVRFGANLTQQQILDTETWVGEKTGINIPLWVSPTVYDSSNNPVLDQFNQTIELY